MTHYSPSSLDKWIGRQSIKDEYWYQHIKCITRAEFGSYEPSVALLSYACDEGVRRNQGRVGAAKGPFAICQQLGRLAWHVDRDILDGGTIHCTDGELEEAQSLLANVISDLLANDHFPIILGGGHDIAWGHFMGIDGFFSAVQANKEVGIINFDAHFDLRPIEEKGNSGTPFEQIAHYLTQENRKFYYACFGIQRASNTKTMFEKAASYGVQFLEYERVKMAHAAVLCAQIDNFCQKVDHVYLTIDMDVFSSAYAPGVSASSVLGCAPDIIFCLIEYLIGTGKVVSVDIAELNPSFDQDHRTAKLAAQLIEHLVYTRSLRNT